MLIIFGKKILNSKKVRFALTQLFGIGFSTANTICNKLCIPNTVKVSELTEFQQSNLSTYIKKYYIVEDKLKQQIDHRIDFYKSINSIRGFRYRSKLPVRGQRTHSNAKTCKRLSKA